MQNQSFRYLWYGQALADLGDVLYIVGLVAILYTATESTFIVGLLPFLNTVGRFLSGFFAPPLINRYPLRSILFYSQLWKTSGLFLFVLQIYFNSSVPLILTFFVISIIAFLDGWAAPATYALLPRLVETHQLRKANSFMATISEMVQFGGWTLGGVAVAYLKHSSILWIVVILYMMASFLMWKIFDPHPFEKKEGRIEWFQEIKEGWQLIWHHPHLKTIHYIFTLDTIANVVWVAALLYIFVQDVLHVSEAWWGYLNSSYFFGLIIGGGLILKGGKWIEKKQGRFIITVAFSTAISTFWFALNPYPVVALFLLAMNGCFDQMKGIILQVFIQKETTTKDLPKVTSAQSALISLVFGVSILFISMLAEVIPIQWIFIASSVILAISAQGTRQFVRSWQK